MNEIDQENLDTAIMLGDAVCKESAICGKKRGQVIFRIYRKLREMEPKKDITAESEAPEAQKADNASSLGAGEA